MSRKRWFWYFREYYRINRGVWPDMSRRVAASDAFKLARKVR